MSGTLVGMTIVWRDCDLCHIPIASAGCTHVEHLDGRVVMSAEEHERLVAELARLRNLEGEQYDGADNGG